MIPITLLRGRTSVATLRRTCSVGRWDSRMPLRTLSSVGSMEHRLGTAAAAATPPSLRSKHHTLEGRIFSSSYLPPHVSRQATIFPTVPFPLASYVCTIRWDARSFSTNDTQQGDTPGRPSPTRKLGTTRVPTPQSPPQDPSTFDKLKQTTPKGLIQQGLDLTVSAFRTGVGFLLRLPGNVFFYITHPDDLRQALGSIKKTAQDEIHHYWVGFKVRVQRESTVSNQN